MPDIANRYQIAISYAHRGSRPSDVAYINQVYQELKRLGFRVFYSDDQDKSAVFWGRNLQDRFHDVFAHAEYIMVFISWEYMRANEGRNILQLEKEIVFSPLSLETESVLPVVFDEPAVPQALKEYGYLLTQNYGQPSDLVRAAKQRYEERGQSTPDKSFFAQAHFHYLHGDIKKAAVCLERAIGLGKDLAEAYFNLGTCRARLYNLREDDGFLRTPDDPKVRMVVECYEKVIELRPNFSGPYFYLGNLKAKCELYKDAIELYEKAIERQPNFASAYNNMGSVKLELGGRFTDGEDEKITLFKQGFNDINKAISLQPKFALAYFNRFRAKNCLGYSWDKAMQDNRKAQELGLENT